VSRFPQGSPERGEAAQVLGLSHYLAGHIAEAIPYLEQVRAATGDSKVTYALAMAYAQTRQPDQAREAIARTFQLPPAAAAAYLLTGQMMNRLELEDQAQAALGQALAKDPKLPEVHYLLGQIAVFRSRYDEGLSLMRAELAISSDDEMQARAQDHARTKDVATGDSESTPIARCTSPSGCLHEAEAHVIRARAAFAFAARADHVA
jgi:tetratricopeptide (TPR) repeat protein